MSVETVAWLCDICGCRYGSEKAADYCCTENE